MPSMLRVLQRIAVYTRQAALERQASGRRSGGGQRQPRGGRRGGYAAAGQRCARHVPAAARWAGAIQDTGQDFKRLFTFFFQPPRCFSPYCRCYHDATRYSRQRRLLPQQPRSVSAPREKPSFTYTWRRCARAARLASRTNRAIALPRLNDVYCHSAVTACCCWYANIHRFASAAATPWQRRQYADVVDTRAVRSLRRTSLSLKPRWSHRYKPGASTLSRR
jgi:hypothetical protein